MLTMPTPPSTKQLGYLKGLGYTGTPPESSGEASKLIDEIKDGMKPAKAERGLLEYRKHRDVKRLGEVKQYLQALDEMNEQYPTCAGFRLVVDKQEAAAETQIYQRAFLPLDVAHKYPELLLLRGLDYSNELVNAPRTGKFVASPGRVIDRSNGKPTSNLGGYLAILVLVFVLVALMASIYRW
jgi:hypothetical protein